MMMAREDGRDEASGAGDAPKRDGKPKPARAPVSVREKSGHLVADTTIERPPAPARRFSMDDEEWIVRLSGQGHAGTGEHGSAYLEAVRFYAAADPDSPVREALIARGRFDSLYDDEFRELFRQAVDISGD